MNWLKKLNGFLILFLLTNSAYAEEPATFTFIEKGEFSPFTGTLFDPLATASVIAQHKTLKEEFDLTLQANLDKLKLEYDLKLENANIAFESLTKEYTLVSEEQKNQIETLNEIIAKQEKKRPGLWLGLGVAGGIGLTAGIVALVQEAK